MGTDTKLSIGKYALYKTDGKLVLLNKKWKKIEQQASIVAGLFSDSREIKCALEAIGGKAEGYIEHVVATTKLQELCLAYCRELVSQTELGVVLLRTYFGEALRVLDAELRVHLSPEIVERRELWIPPSVFLRFKTALASYRVMVVEPIVSIIEQRRTHRKGNLLNGGRPSDIGLQELLSQAEADSIATSDLAARLVAHRLDGKPTGARSTRVRREAKRLATAMGRLKSSLASAVPVGTKPRKPT